MTTARRPKLHILLGAGGVGKTTLSAALALALAESGQKVGLLSIDPAKRLKDALGIDLSGEGVFLPIQHPQGALHVSMLHVDQALKRWVSQGAMSPAKQQALAENPYYIALSEKLASSTELLAAVCLAEWAERYPHFDHLVVDTAPGFHAIDFIIKPDKMALFLDSKLVEWLKTIVDDSDSQKSKPGLFKRLIKTGAQKILDGLSLVGGRNFLINFGQFLVLLESIFFAAVKRIQFARSWISDPSSRLIIVSSVREDATAVAKYLVDTLATLQLKPALSILNKALSQEFMHDQAIVDFLDAPHSPDSCTSFCAHYISNYIQNQKAAQAHLQEISERVVWIGNALQLDKNSTFRIADLQALGYSIVDALP